MRPALRLRRSSDFAQVRQQGSSYRHSVLLLAVCCNGLPHNRYGIVAGKRLGVAVRRNRSKRLLRALIDRIHAYLSPGHDIVLIAQPGLLQQPFAELQRIICALFTRAGVLEVGVDAQVLDA